MRFVVEESSWAWDGSDPADYCERIERMLDRLDVARERGERYAASRELLGQSVLEGYTLGDLFWNEGSPLNLPVEVIQRVTAHFNWIQYWDDDREWPAIELKIADREVISVSAALAHENTGNGHAVACIPLPGTWSGPCSVVVGTQARTIHFVVDEGSHRAFFRDALVVEGENAGNLRLLAPHAYPDLYFLDSVWDGVRHFEGGYARVKRALRQLLAILDDHGAWVFTDTTDRLSPSDVASAGSDEKPVTKPIVKSRFRALGLDIVPENPDVRSNGERRRARERELGGKTLYCEWHYRFEPHINRAHIHPPVDGSQGTAWDGKVIVAIFRDHLP